VSSGDAVRKRVLREGARSVLARAGARKRPGLFVSPPQAPSAGGNATTRIVAPDNRSGAYSGRHDMTILPSQSNHDKPADASNGPAIRPTSAVRASTSFDAFQEGPEVKVDFGLSLHFS
jgi:hypothetical protein